MDELIMTPDSVMRIYGKGTAAIGKVLCDNVRIGQRIKILSKDGEILQESRIVSIGDFWKNFDEANKGQEVAFILREVQGELPKGISIIKDAIQNT